MSVLEKGVFGEAFVDDSTYIRNVNTTEQTPANDVAFVTVRLSDGRLGHQPTVMRSASSELQKTVDELQATVAQLKEQAAQIQKVSAQLEATKPSPQTVLNNRLELLCLPLFEVGHVSWTIFLPVGASPPWVQRDSSATTKERAKN